MPPRLARLLAVVVAVALIGGAFWWRGRGDDGSGGGGGDGPGATGDLRVACVTELEPVCRALAESEGFDLDVEPAAETVAALADAEPGDLPYDAWVTLDPWPAMVDAARAADEPALFTIAATAVAHTPLSVVMPADRFTALAGACGDPITWECVARQAGTNWAEIAPDVPAAATWGAFKVGVGGRDDALGSLLFGQLVAGVATEADLPTDYGTGDFSAQLVQILRRPTASAEQKDTAAELDLIRSQAGSYSLVAADGPSASRTATSPQGVSRKLRAFSLAPPARADAVVAPLATGRRGEQVAELFAGEAGATAFRELGWSPGQPAGTNGLPAPDVLVALQEKTR